MVLGASFDAPEDNRRFREKFGYPFDILTDADRRLAMALGAATEPTAAHAKRQTFVIGPDGRLEQRIERVDAKTHPATLLETLPAR